MTRLKDVAEAAGVSIRTVTRALKNAPDVSARTREHVQKLATAMCYRPDLAARALKKRERLTVGMVVANLDELTVAKAAALENRLRENGYSLELLFSTSPDGDTALEALLNRRPAGIALLNVGEAIRTAAVEADIPLVLLDAPEKTRYDGIIIDRPKGVSEAVNYLLDKGYRRVAYVGPPTESGGRLQGYRRALQERTTPIRPWYVKESGLSCWESDQFEYGRSAAGCIAEAALQDRPDALICYTDRIALGILHGFHHHGIAVPDEIGVIGFDDREAAQLSCPRLSTVSQPNGAVGTAAAEMLLAKMVDQESGRSHKAKRVPSVVVPTRLVIRESS